MQITHIESSSIMKPLSSGDADSQKSKEGINGCVLIDETHVVDRRFVDRVSRAGISRSEPFQIEVSTAGNDPDGYGRSAFDYGRQVESGAVADEQLFFSCYAAPQDLSDADLDANPAKWGKLANPAWNRLIDPDEFLSDYQRSKRNASDLASFKMYRLNIWQQAANPWLKSEWWTACRDTFTVADVAHLPCWAGMDLSKTRDMSAVVLVFRDDDNDCFYQVPFFWIPENRAAEIAHHAPFMEWHRAGFLNFCAGGTIDQRDIRAKIGELAETLNICEVIYDPTFAEELSKGVEEDHGITRVECRQSMNHLAGPTADYERLVMEGKLKHNGHPVLSWQANHVQVWTSKQDDKKRMPCKPGGSGSKDHRTIDGIAAGVMAVSGAVANRPGQRCYVNHSVLYAGDLCNTTTGVDEGVNVHAEGDCRYIESVGSSTDDLWGMENP